MPTEAVPTRDHPAEAVRLLEEFEREVRGIPEAEWLAPSISDRLQALHRGDDVDGYLILGPSDEAIGISVTSPPSEAGLTVHPYLSRGYRTPAALAAFLEALARHAPVRVVYEPIVGVAAGALAPLLAGLGYRRVVRTDMVFPETTPLPPVATEGDHPLRPLTADDGPALTRLMERAYSDNIEDRTLFQRYRDPAEDARHSIAGLLGQDLGTWRSDCSFGVPVDGGLAAATLLHEFHGPLISEVMTDPTWRRRGFARRLLTATVRAARESGLPAPRLVVTIGNDRAHALYRSLGFVEKPELAGGTWIRPLTL